MAKGRVTGAAVQAGHRTLDNQLDGPASTGTNGGQTGDRAAGTPPSSEQRVLAGLAIMGALVVYGKQHFPQLISGNSGAETAV